MVQDLVRDIRFVGHGGAMTVVLVDPFLQFAADLFFFSSRRRHTRSVSAFLLNRSSDLPGNNVYVGFMVWSNFTATKCRGLVSLNQVIKEIICLQPLK